MNRVIKFRAYHRQLKTMINVYVIDQTLHSGTYLNECKGWYGSNNQVSFAYDQVDWLQFTGLLDKHGKPIYEGDIVTNENYHWQSLLSEVVYVPPCFWLMNIPKSGRGIPAWNLSDVEVIGNIYEHSHILETK